MKDVSQQTGDRFSATPAIHSEELAGEPDKPRMFLYDILMVLHAVALFSLWALQYSRFGWMVDGTQKLWLWLAVGIAYWALYKRSHVGWYFTLIGACLLMVATSIVGGFVNGPVMLNETHYAMIDQIPWDDTEYLAQHGFENDGTWYNGTVLERWDLEKDEAVYYSLEILVRDIDDESPDLSQYDVHYGDSYIDEYIFSVRYEDAFSEWLRAPCYVNRAFYVISDGKEIVFWETDETAPFDIARVESLLEELAAGVDPQTGEKRLRQP